MKLRVSSLPVSVATSTWDFCFVIGRSLTRPNVPLSGSENKFAAIGWELPTRNVTFADARQQAQRFLNGPLTTLAEICQLPVIAAVAGDDMLFDEIASEPSRAALQLHRVALRAYL